MNIGRFAIAVYREAICNKNDKCLLKSPFKLEKREEEIAIEVLYNWLIWRVLKLAFFFKKVFSLYLF